MSNKHQNTCKHQNIKDNKPSNNPMVMVAAKICADCGKPIGNSFLVTN